MPRISESTAAKAADTAGTPDPWTELETSVNLAIACIHLLTTFACQEIEDRSHGLPEDGLSDELIYGLTGFGADTSRRLRNAFTMTRRILRNGPHTG